LEVVGHCRGYRGDWCGKVRLDEERIFITLGNSPLLAA